MAGIPDSIKALKPQGFGALELRSFVDGVYYVYQISSKWDPERKKARKVTGKSIGKITLADGFIPNTYGFRLIKEKEASSPSSPVKVLEYGAYEVLRQLSPSLEDKLREFFPKTFREIRTIALLRLVDGASAKLMKDLFLSSSLSDMSPDLSMSEQTVRQFISALGQKTQECEAFMKSFVMPGTTLLFDGTSIFTRSSDSLAQKGYNPLHRKATQARILYVFERESNRPVFYRVLQGSIVDKRAFVETVRSCGCTDCTVIADKGFYSKPNLSHLIENGLKFILPLQENTKNVDDCFYEDLDDHKFGGVFAYKGRTIWFHKKASGEKGNWIYTFRDDERRQQLQTRFVEKAEHDYGEKPQSPMDVLQNPRLGYYSFCSNLDVEPKEIFLAYKERWDIEQCFDYLKNTVASSASHAQSDDYFRGWVFLNHVSLLYFYGLINGLRRSGLAEDYCPEDIIKLVKNIYKVKFETEESFKTSEITDKVQGILDRLGVDLLRKN